MYLDILWIHFLSQLHENLLISKTIEKIIFTQKRKSKRPNTYQNPSEATALCGATKVWDFWFYLAIYLFNISSFIYQSFIES